MKLFSIIWLLLLTASIDCGKSRCCSYLDYKCCCANEFGEVIDVKMHNKYYYTNEYRCVNRGPCVIGWKC